MKKMPGPLMEMAQEGKLPVKKESRTPAKPAKRKGGRKAARSSRY